MATTFTKILIHFIFSTKDRHPLITPEMEPDLHAYMVGIAQNHKCWTMAINSVPDHVHMLVSMSKNITVVDLMENVCPFCKPHLQFGEASGQTASVMT